jgi:hypothetical protein
MQDAAAEGESAGASFVAAPSSPKERLLHPREESSPASAAAALSSPPSQPAIAAMEHAQYAVPQLNNGGQLPAYTTPANQYGHYNGAVQPATMPSNGHGPAAMMRYAIPPQTPLDAQRKPGMRGKEIKRRT